MCSLLQLVRFFHVGLLSWENNKTVAVDFANIVRWMCVCVCVVYLVFGSGGSVAAVYIGYLGANSLWPGATRICCESFLSTMFALYPDSAYDGGAVDEAKWIVGDESHTNVLWNEQKHEKNRRKIKKKNKWLTNWWIKSAHIPSGKTGPIGSASRWRTCWRNGLSWCQWWILYWLRRNVCVRHCRRRRRCCQWNCAQCNRYFTLQIAMRTGHIQLDLATIKFCICINQRRYRARARCLTFNS